MSIDLDKIRQKVAQLSGKGKKNNLWWPEIGKDYNVRVIPWPDGNDGSPYKERAFYYGIGSAKSILAPFQFNKEDPIQALITKLRKGASPGELELAKQFYPKRKYYIPVVVRGEEELGVRLWSVNKETLTDVLNLMLGDAGDVSDVKDGRDITVKCSSSGRKFQGRDVAKITIQPKMSVTAAGTAKQMKEWNSSFPNLDEMYSLMDADDIEKHVNDHLNGGSTPDGTEKTQAGKPVSTELSTEELAEHDDVFSKLTEIADGDE